MKTTDLECDIRPRRPDLESLADGRGADMISKYQRLYSDDWKWLVGPLQDGR